ncbi:uncharacterized protein LOC121698999 isoform X1 [Alosa sapidissima]|uniref:uncharacterized protein LOC121698999 isoform X1 n=1 Tax=Alosa sapidissima TaxID=34773 RepID=UPI001C08D3DB|nr:uncharacterized protein LOC121698999 isoform X1 [Alosa sapidissima]
MSFFTIVLPLQMLFSATIGSHFWGGSMTFSPKGVYQNGSYKVEFRFKQTFDRCSYFTWNNCISGNCGIEGSLKSGEIYNTAGRHAGNFNWCQTEGIRTRLIPTDNPFSLSERSGNWVSLQNGVVSWRLLTVVDLGKRSDTNKANRSPVTTSISFVSVPQNCPRMYTLVTFDPDNDQGRCRYGTLLDQECSVCQLPLGFTLTQNRIKEKDFCSLHYNKATTGVYGLELVVEDFPQQNIILSYNNGSRAFRGPFNQAASPLSKLPLHFAVKVDPPIASCDEGVFLPKFVPPTPENGDTIQAVINQELKIIINATASEAGIRGLVISGPLNITSSSERSDGLEQLVLKWTPRSDDLGEYFPICFIAETNPINSTYYQSDMRCIIVEVGNPPETVVGLRMMVESTDALTEAEIEEKVIKPLQEELIRNGLPNTTTLSLRRVYSP